MSYFVQAENFAVDSENRIHSDEIAKKLGFRGALVPGVTVYGYLTRPLLDRFGPAWLASSSAAVRLLKPTYDGDRVRIELDEGEDQCVVNAFDADAQLLAVLTSSVAEPLPAPEDLRLLNSELKHPDRVEISWDTVHERTAFAPWSVDFTAEENSRFTSEAKDDAPIYAKIVHPHFLLSLANTALTNEYIMPTWIHVGSETRHRAVLAVGDTIAIRTVVLDKWRKKGHEFVRIYVTFWRDGELTTDILHTAIFKVAE